MDLLFSIRDLGIPEPLPNSLDTAVRGALSHAIDIDTNAPARRSRWSRRLLRRSSLIPVALLVTTAAAAAATTVATGVFDHTDQLAKRNVHDTPLQLFKTPLAIEAGATPASAWRETVVPSSVRKIATSTIPGIGKVQYWVANTKQHGYCTAIRLPDGSWAGLKNYQQFGLTVAGCDPTRAQIGHGALILSGFNYTSSEVLTKRRKTIVLDYGEVTVPGHPTTVRWQYGGPTARVIDGKYFLLVLKSERLAAEGDYKLVALNASGKVIANETKPLPGTPTVKCVGRYDVRRHHIPGTKRTSTVYSCHRYLHTIAK